MDSGDWSSIGLRYHLQGYYSRDVVSYLRHILEGAVDVSVARERGNDVLQGLLHSLGRLLEPALLVLGLCVVERPLW